MNTENTESENNKKRPFFVKVGKTSKKIVQASKKGANKTMEIPGKTIKFTKEGVSSIKQGFQEN